MALNEQEIGFLSFMYRENFPKVKGCIGDREWFFSLAHVAYFSAAFIVWKKLDRELNILFATHPDGINRPARDWGDKPLELCQPFFEKIEEYYHTWRRRRGKIVQKRVSIGEARSW